MKIDTKSEDVVYVTIGNWTIYIDNSTGEKIVEQWTEGSREKCRICNTIISSEDEKIPLTDGACYNCTFGPTGDPEDTEER